MTSPPTDAIEKCIAWANDEGWVTGSCPSVPAREQLSNLIAENLQLQKLAKELAKWAGEFIYSRDVECLADLNNAIAEFNKAEREREGK